MTGLVTSRVSTDNKAYYQSPLHACSLAQGAESKSLVITELLGAFGTTDCPDLGER